MDKKIILFDIDGTLVNADLIGEMIYKKISEVSGLEVKKIKEIKDEFRLKVTGYNVNDLIDYIAQKNGLDLTSLKEFLTSESVYSDYIYDDVKNVLSELSQNYNLGIFSDGDPSYQNKKISSIRNFFQEDLIFITLGKLKNDFYKKIPSEVIVVDDDRNVLESLRQKRPDIEVIWINRKDEEKSETPKTETIKNLTELLTLD